MCILLSISSSPLQNPHSLDLYRSSTDMLSYNVQGPCACNNESPPVSGTMHGVTCISCI